MRALYNTCSWIMGLIVVVLAAGITLFVLGSIVAVIVSALR